MDQIPTLGSSPISIYEHKIWVIWYYFLDYTCPKHEIQTIRFLWIAKHGHGVSFQDLTRCESWEIYEKLSTRYKKVYLTLILALQTLPLILFLFLRLLFEWLYFDWSIQKRVKKPNKHYVGIRAEILSKVSLDAEDAAIQPRSNW